jgi:hypothetical protein
MRNWFVPVVVFAALAGSAMAQTGPALLLKPLVSETETWESRGDALFLRSGTDSNDDDYQMNVYQASGRVREQREKFVPRLGWDLTYIDTNSHDPGIPQNLTDVSIAAGVSLGEYYDWTAGLTVGVGYAGDTPFGQSDAWYGKATLIVGKKLDEKTDLAFVLDYDGNRTIFSDFPVPGIAYRHQYDKTLSYTAGIPVSAVSWKPTNEFSLDVTWVFIDRFEARAEYALTPAWKLYGALESRQQAFHVESVGGNDRLFFQQKRAEIGVTWKPLAGTSFYAGGGYAFNGEFSEGWDTSDSNLVADLSDEPYIRFGYERQF